MQFARQLHIRGPYVVWGALNKKGRRGDYGSDISDGPLRGTGGHCARGVAVLRHQAGRLAKRAGSRIRSWPILTSHELDPRSSTDSHESHRVGGRACASVKHRSRRLPDRALSEDTVRSVDLWRGTAAQTISGEAQSVDQTISGEARSVDQTISGEAACTVCAPRATTREHPLRRVCVPEYRESYSWKKTIREHFVPGPWPSTLRRHR